MNLCQNPVGLKISVFRDTSFLHFQPWSTLVFLLLIQLYEREHLNCRHLCLSLQGIRENVGVKSNWFWTVPVPCLCSSFTFPAFVNSENAGKSTCDIFIWPVDALALVLGKGGGSCIYCSCSMFVFLIYISSFCKQWKCWKINIWHFYVASRCTGTCFGQRWWKLYLLHM